MTILVTAGPTREFLDPVRYISNRSSGKMGCAVAESALCHGHKVILVAGPLAVTPPEGAEVINVVSAREMLAAVEANLDRCDALVAAAAVADYRPIKCEKKKIKKDQIRKTKNITMFIMNIMLIFSILSGVIHGIDIVYYLIIFTIINVGVFSITLPYMVNLIPNPDILATIAKRKGKRIFVGFAAETDDLIDNAAKKLKRKNLDMIVANDVTKPGAGFDTDTNEVVFITADNSTTHIPMQSKSAIADLIIKKIEELSKKVA